MLSEAGAEAFAERARRELQAAGVKVRKRANATQVALTAKEVEIARLAQGGFTNPEIAARLFLSPHTVEGICARSSRSWESPPAKRSARCHSKPWRARPDPPGLVRTRSPWLRVRRGTRPVPPAERAR
ncbi:LuxR C-terminal-related transcriptional regulator [Streptomyces sp. NPDC058914]|uniref:LuxR C-terminal-related transcriptional regulator n=1 Tax=Streptomyces TaxID=1883 RepID=UPI003673CA9B